MADRIFHPAQGQHGLAQIGVHLGRIRVHPQRCDQGFFRQLRFTHPELQIAQGIVALAEVGVEGQGLLKVGPGCRNVALGKTDAAQGRVIMGRLWLQRQSLFCQIQS